MGCVAGAVNRKKTPRRSATKKKDKRNSGRWWRRLPPVLRTLVELYAVDGVDAVLQLQEACRRGDAARIAALRGTGYALAHERWCWAWACEAGWVEVARTLVYWQPIAVPSLGGWPPRVYQFVAVERRGFSGARTTHVHRTVVDASGLHVDGQPAVALHRIRRIALAGRRPSFVAVEYQGADTPLQIYTGRLWAAERRFELSVLASCCL
jgi:hypothetical protein